jgi:5-histidylcysteine sulfoxide synthase/putative 4-mercaptohistidine N1-methyltranferase
MIKIRDNLSLHGKSIEEKRLEIRDYFLTTYTLYEELFSHIIDERAYYEKADRLRHPLIFYFGHTAAFFMNKLILAYPDTQRIDPHLEALFAVGVDEMSWDDLNEKHYAWPTVKETRDYRERVKAYVLEVIEKEEFSLPIQWDAPIWSVIMGIEHERIHIETSSVLIRQTPLAYLQPLANWPIAKTSHQRLHNELLTIPAGKVVHNKKHNDAMFYGWDNEYGYHEADIPAFKASKFLVSNAEFLTFMKDGGYENVAYWQEEGWRWKVYSDAKHPLFWVKKEKGFHIRLLAQEVDFLYDHPVEVNYHEAKAFCNWKKAKEGREIRLPTEDEWYRLVAFCQIKDASTPPVTDANLNLKHFASTTSIDSFNHHGLYDVIGNVWQWTQTAIYPYEGFKTHPLYDDFSTPTFDHKHHLIKGGSWISMGNETLLSSRYAFRKHFYQHAGFRYVESSYVENLKENIYESDTLLSQYIAFGWGKEILGVENYPASCIKIALSYMRDKPIKKALDIGCATGRSTFELARVFDEVTGLDFTANFIAIASKIKEEKSLQYSQPIEGDIVVDKHFSLEEFDLVASAEKVSFWQADACNLKERFYGYDLIFAGNLIDRLYDPQKFLTDLSWRLHPQGLLVLTSPYTWLETFTPKEKWIGGYKKGGKALLTIDGLKEILEDDFRLIDTRDIPFVLQESARKHQYTIAQMSIWEKRL